jgi:hypothetical protein
MQSIFEHDEKIYAIAPKHHGYFIVIKASWMTGGKKKVEEMRIVKADSLAQVKEMIEQDRFDEFKKLGE